MFSLVMMAGASQPTKDPKFEKDLLSGIISLVLLAVTAKSPEPMYGYKIAKELGDPDAGVHLKQGTIYPVLRSLEKKGLLTSEIKASESGPPRKYYIITQLGRDTLASWTTTWQGMMRYVSRTLEVEA